MAYYSIFIILSLFTFLDFTKNKNLKYIKLVLVFLVFIILSLFAGLRNEHVGADYFNYIKMFEYAPSLDNIFDFQSFLLVSTEPFYYALNVFTKTLFDSYYSIFLLTALLAVGINSYNYNKYSPFVILSLLIYFSHLFLYKEMIQIRAGLASAILLFSIQYLYNKEKIKYFGVVLVASLFHSGALIFLPFYFFYKFNISNQTYYKLLAFSIVMYLLVDSKNLLLMFNDLGILPYAVYNYLIWDKYNYSLGLFNPVTIKQFLVVLFLLKYRNLLSEKVNYFDAMLYLYIISTAWLIFFADFAIIAARVATFLSIVDVILLPSLIYVFKQKRLIYFAIWLYALMMLYLNIEVKEVLNTYEMVGF
uniref:EpsG family protein n=1 Tax=Aliarcobacter sp. TaxID=2321116 RepID=UPI004048EA31